MSVSKYDIVHVPEIRTTSDDLPAYANSPINGKGVPNLGPRGLPLIEISDMGLADMDTAIITIFHEIYHQRMYVTWPKTLGGRHDIADIYGEAMLALYKRRTGQ